MSVHPSRRLVASLASAAALALALAGCSSGSEDAGKVEVTFFMGNVEANVVTAQALITAFEAKNSNIKINLDSSGPTGTEGDNLTKTRLATGEMADMFWYNSGSLLQALNPDQTLYNFADAAWVDRVNPSFRAVVSTDKGVYGAPAGAAMGGGVLYHVPTYESLGLKVPTTWAEFQSNNQKLKDAGKVPVIQSYSDTWTSQLFVLADFYNIYAADKDWAKKYTANQVKYATDPVARAGFEHLQEIHASGFLNEDFASTTFDDALRRIAEGEGAHYPMLTFAVSTIVDLYPTAAGEVGFFAMPGTTANGLTTWMPPAIYAPANTRHPEEVGKFLDFVASTEGCDAMTAAITVSGPYLVQGCTIPDDVPKAVADMLPYFERDGGTSPALEFLSPVKGPALEQITVEVGSGIRSAQDGAALYDEDVKKQAQQLGLAGW